MCCNGLITFLALAIGTLALIYVAYQLYSFVKCGCGKYGPFVSSYGQIKEDILDEARKILKASKKPLKITDLGCGSGALLIPLAKEFPEHQFIGLEWDIVPLTMGKIKAHSLKNIQFVKGDYMKTDHSDMDLIMCYVLKTTGEPLGKKLSKEIKDTTIVISEMFPLYHLDEIKQIQSSIYGIKEKIFIYKKPQNLKKTTSSSKKTTPKTTKVAKEEPKKTTPKTTKVAKEEPKKTTPKTTKVVKEEPKKTTPKTTKVAKEEPKKTTPKTTKVVKEEPKKTTPKTTKVAKEEPKKTTPKTTKVVKEKPKKATSSKATKK